MISVVCFLILRMLSMQGWPDNDAQAGVIPPLDVMETGSDILFFWVARMAMLCEEVHPIQSTGL